MNGNTDIRDLMIQIEKARNGWYSHFYRIWDLLWARDMPGF